MRPSLRRIVATFSQNEEMALIQLRGFLRALEAVEVSLEGMNSSALAEIKGPLSTLSSAANQMKVVLRKQLNSDQLRWSANLTHLLEQTMLKWSRMLG